VTEPVYTATPDEPAELMQHSVTARDLWDAADALTQPTRQRLIRDHGPTEWIVLPSLFDQLVEAIDSGRGGAGHGKQTSKPPLDAQALSLLIEIAEHIRSGCWNWRVKRTFDNPRDLRQIVSAVIRHNQPTEIAATHKQIRGWASKIRTLISSDPDRTWRMHSAACRVCGSVSVPVFADDGTQTRQPALAVHSADGVIDHIECGFCGSILTGPDLAAIVTDTLRAQRRADEASA